MRTRTRGPRVRGQVDHELVMTDVSAGEAVPQGPKAPRGWEARAIAQQGAQAQVTALLEQMSQHLGGILTAATAVPRGDVLWQGSLLLPANGYITRGFKTAYAAIAVANTGTSPLTVHSSTAMSQAPTVGTGVAVVPVGSVRTIALRGTAVTVYGTPGAQFDLTAYVRPRDPNGSSIGGVADSNVQSVPVVAPVAGTTAFNFGPTTSVPFKLTSLYVSLTTDATVGTRTLGLDCYDAAGNFLFHRSTSAAAVASGTYHWSFAGSAAEAFAGFNDVVPLQNIWVPAGAHYQIVLGGTGGAGDVLSQITYTYETAGATA